MIKITSSANKICKYIKLLASKKGRMEYGVYTVEGKKSVQDAISADREISCIAVSESFYEQAFFSYPNGIDLYQIADGIFEKLCDTKAPQGILAVIKMKNNHAWIPNIEKAYIYCDRIQDPGNLGTIIRTADAAGFGGVILSEESVDLYSPKTVRASMGSFFHIDVMTEQSIIDLERYKSMGFTLYGGALSEKTIPYLEADFKKPSILVLGNEANGISDEVLALCTCIKIPILGNAESLNVSIAAAILMYELVRQRS